MIIARRFFLTGLAAGIAAPLIVPRHSLMAMPRAPLVIPRGGAKWNGHWYPTVQDALHASLDYMHNNKPNPLVPGATSEQLSVIEVYKEGTAWHPQLNLRRRPEDALRLGVGDTLNIHHRWTIT